MIPKTIHYCWFGGAEKPDIVKKCINSWKKHCPDYEIIEWNESNFDLDIYPYVREAYNAKKWAFVSDVARLSIIYNNGGIYLDTDVELLDNIEEWNQYPCWLAFEGDIYINTGLGFGAQVGNPMVKIMLEDYSNKHFLKKNGEYNMKPCPAINTDAILTVLKGLTQDGSTQYFSNCMILSTTQYKTKAVHHYTGSWKSETSVKSTSDWKDNNITLFLKSPRIRYFIRRYFGKRISDLYIFCVYDLIFNGPIYYIKRKLEKKDGLSSEVNFIKMKLSSPHV